MTAVVDTHCHLGDAAFDHDRADVLDRMFTAGVTHALVIESQVDQLDRTRSWVAPDRRLRLATACHPHDAARWSDGYEELLTAAWSDPAVAAVGEIGLDYHYDHAPRPVQRDVFARQLELAVHRELPVIIHAREADADVVAILVEQPRATVVLHSFAGGAVLRDAALDRGWFCSFSGMVTFKSWAPVEAVAMVSSDRLLVETDAPYLAPVPYRGQRNEPARVVTVADRVAALRGVSASEIAEATTANAIRLFWRDD